MDTDRARVYLLRIPDQPVERADMTAWLQRVSDPERMRILRYRNWADQLRALGAALLARYALAEIYRITPTEVVLARDGRGRPFMQCPEGFAGDFNVSHHGAWVGCAVVEIGRVGLDIVYPAEFTPAVLAAFNAAERRYVENIADGQRRKSALAKLWATKEAVLKMLGTGLFVDPSAVEIQLDSLQTGRLSLIANNALAGNDAICLHEVAWVNDVFGVVATDQMCNVPELHTVMWGRAVAGEGE